MSKRWSACSRRFRSSWWMIALLAACTARDSGESTGVSASTPSSLSRSSARGVSSGGRASRDASVASVDAVQATAVSGRAPCDVLQQRSRRNVERGVERARETVRRLVQRDVDPLAPDRRPVVAELEEARRRGIDASTIAGIESRLESLRSEHASRLIAAMERNVGTRVDIGVDETRRCVPFADGS
jgi:hypothetical protein